MSKIYDAVVIGSGAAGIATAVIARRSGASILVVEKDGFGGTCPLRGCIPKKILSAAAESMACINRAPEHRISVRGADLNWKELIDLKRSMIRDVPAKSRDRFHSLGIDTVQGFAKFTGPRSIDVDGKEYQGKKIVIATGSKPRQLPIAGFEHALTSDDLFELEALPSSIIFIGGGAIGMEFAHIFVRAGSKVTVLEAASRILPDLDEDLINKLTGYSESLGIKISTGVHVESIQTSSQGMTVTLNVPNITVSSTISADIVANGTGRIADIDGLDLHMAGIKTDRRGIVLDEYLRSVTNPDVFVAGDTVSSSPHLSPVASYEGRIVAHNITSKDLVSPDYQAIPSAIYTIPAVASVGLTEYEAKKQGYEFATAFHDLQSLRVSEIYNEQIAFSKVIIERQTNLILGAHILGHDAQELINIFALAMKFGITARDLHDTIYSYPTFSSGIPIMVRFRV
ncbi:MAG TPA: NAD(P)/FAD-dependent oxidoreductase [Deltaproteobacteria bacterium]|jgi:glutathione reductase (NADPH)|nr:NAD(P)/FAD-dependent oxidoreductase [Deltaproteobacteria bacterium]HQI02860.1 NAD(P)/FAD-dependent oxidoreductase [Deltaproteobacteria bacterium]